MVPFNIVLISFIGFLSIIIHLLIRYNTLEKDYHWISTVLGKYVEKHGIEEAEELLKSIYG